MTSQHPVPVGVQVFIVVILLVIGLVPLGIIIFVKASHPNQVLTNKEAFYVPLRWGFNTFDGKRTKLTDTQINTMKQFSNYCVQNRDCTTDCFQTRNKYFQPTGLHDPAKCPYEPVVINICISQECKIKKMPLLDTLEFAPYQDIQMGFEGETIKNGL